MPDARRHRGPHPEDRDLFAPEQLPRLRLAVEEVSWLLGRGYPGPSAVRVAGDHHQLHRRQRVAVRRCSASAEHAAVRRARRLPAGGRIAVDGFNALVTTEAALSGGVLLRGVDGLWRDLSSVHGSYRRVEETARAMALLTGGLSAASSVVWILDRPVSNSGRVAGLLREAGFEDVRLEDRADGALIALGAAGWTVATSDGPLLDRVPAGVDLVGPLVARLDGAWRVNLA